MHIFFSSAWKSFFFIVFYSIPLYSLSVQTVSSSVECIVNAVTSAHCSNTLVPGCSYWLLFSPADFPSLSESRWTAELNDKLLPHTSPYVQLHRLLRKGLKYHRLQTACEKPFVFEAFSVLCVCLQAHNFIFSSQQSNINLSVWRPILVLLL